jgi:hypothetical protein
MSDCPLETDIWFVGIYEYALVDRDIGLNCDPAVSGDFVSDEFHILVFAQRRADNPKRLQSIQKRRISADFREFSAQAVDHIVGKTGWS